MTNTPDTRLITAAELVKGDTMIDPNGNLHVESVGVVNGAIRVLVAAVDDEFCQTWTFNRTDLCRVVRPIARVGRVR